jgi:hypothetical protein
MGRNTPNPGPIGGVTRYVATCLKARYLFPRASVTYCC